jgi:hypothetical protein
MRIEFGPSNVEETVNEIKNAVFYLALFASIYLLAMLFASSWPGLGVATFLGLSGGAVLLFKRPGRMPAALGLLALGSVLCAYLGPLWSVVAGSDQPEIAGRLLPVALVALGMSSLARVLVGVSRFPGLRPTIRKPRW